MKRQHPSGKRFERHLTIAKPVDLPRSFAELADESNRSASLRKTLGERSYWLCTSELVGIYRPNGLTVGELRFTDNRIPLAVKYIGTRRLTELSYVDSMTGEIQQLDCSNTEYVVMELLPRESLKLENDVEIYNEHIELMDEVAIAMGQSVTLLDENEHKADSLYVPNVQDRAFLRVVPSATEGDS